MGVGNVYRHDYDNVQPDFVWRTVHERLPALLAAVEDEIALATSPEPLSDAGEPEKLLKTGEQLPHPYRPDVNQ